MYGISQFMKVLKLAALLFFLLGSLNVAYGQSETELDISKVNLTAGDPLELTIGPLDNPLACDTYVYIDFRSASYSFGFGTNGKKGDTSVQVKNNLPKDLPAGEYVSTIGHQNACPGYVMATDFPVPKKS
jgi:hypothetical protein